MYVVLQTVYLMQVISLYNVVAVIVNYRGDVKAKEAEATIQWLKSYKKCCPVCMYSMCMIRYMMIFDLKMCDASANSL